MVYYVIRGPHPFLLHVHPLISYHMCTPSGSGVVEKIKNPPPNIEIKHHDLNLSIFSKCRKILEASKLRNPHILISAV